MKTLLKKIKELLKINSHKPHLLGITVTMKGIYNSKLQLYKNCEKDIPDEKTWKNSEEFYQELIDNINYPFYKEYLYQMYIKQLALQKNK